MTELIVYTNLYNRYRTALCNCLSYSRTKSADYAVFLSCYNYACFLSTLADKLLIKRLDCVDIYNSCGDSLSFKNLCSFNSLVYKKSCCNDCYIASVL